MQSFQSYIKENRNPAKIKAENDGKFPQDRLPNNVEFTKSANKLGDTNVVKFAAEKGYGNIAGVAVVSPTHWVNLFEPDSQDYSLLQGISLKEGEKIYRAVTNEMVSGGIMSFMKVNVYRGLVYFAKDTEFGDESVDFESRGVKPKVINLVQDKDLMNQLDII